MLWHIKESGVYLLGSVHFLPENSPPLPDLVWDVHKKSAIVVFESDLDNPPTNHKEKAFLKKGEHISSLISPHAFSALKKIWAEVGIDPPLKNLQPWYVNLILALELHRTENYSHALGVDKQIWKATEPEKRKFLEGHEAINALSDAPVSETVLGLETMALAPNLSKLKLKRLYDFWVTSNVRDMGLHLEEMRATAPIQMKALFDKRNNEWLPQIIDLAKAGENTLIVVGAYHMPGEGGILALLTGAGFEVDFLSFS